MVLKDNGIQIIAYWYNTVPTIPISNDISNNLSIFLIDIIHSIPFSITQQDFVWVLELEKI